MQESRTSSQLQDKCAEDNKLRRGRCKYDAPRREGECRQAAYFFLRLNGKLRMTDDEKNN